MLITRRIELQFGALFSYLSRRFVNRPFVRRSAKGSLVLRANL